MLHRTVRRLAVLAMAASLAGPMIALAAPGSPTSFHRDPAVTRGLQQQLIDQARAQNPPLAVVLEKLLGMDTVDLLRPQLREAGLDPDDMADMTAMYWINAWEAANGVDAETNDPVLSKAARKQIADGMAKDPRIAKLTDAQKQNVADGMMLQGMIVGIRAEGVKRQGAAAQKAMSDAVNADALRITKTDMRSLVLTPEGFKPKAGAQAAATPPPTAAGAGRYARNWEGVEGVYFRLFYTFGAGGMMIADYQPVVLFKDGSYYRVEGQPLEDMDLAASRAAKPARWGRWSQGAAGFVLVDEKGKSGDPMRLQDGKFFKAYAADAGGGKLADTYTRVSGGGNTALGGDTMIAFQTDITFAADGTYGRKSAGGGSNSGQYTGASVVTSARSGNDGRYQIARHTITTTQADGSVKRQFFAFGSKGTPARPETGMMFMGDNVYTVMSSRKR